MLKRPLTLTLAPRDKTRRPGYDGSHRVHACLAGPNGGITENT